MVIILYMDEYVGKICTVNFQLRRPYYHDIMVLPSRYYQCHPGSLSSINLILHAEDCIRKTESINWDEAKN